MLVLGEKITQALRGRGLDAWERAQGNFGSLDIFIMCIKKGLYDENEAKTKGNGNGKPPE